MSLKYLDIFTYAFLLKAGRYSVVSEQIALRTLRLDLLSIGTKCDTRALGYKSLMCKTL
jgi:hypothetical protein